MKKAEEEERRLISRRLLDLLFMAQFVLVILVLCLVIGLQFVTSGRQAKQTKQIGEISTRQNQFIQHQNDVANCSLHDSLTASKKIMLALGLPGAEDIHPPDVSNLNCDVLLRGGEDNGTD